MTVFELDKFDVAEFDRILSKGLSKGLGDRDSRVCIEAAICQVIGLPHSDDPGCVADSVRAFKIRLNDSTWSSPKARADGLRDLGLAQLGSKGVVHDQVFAKRMATETIRVLVPKLFRQVLSNDKACMEAADKCENEPTEDSAARAARAAWVRETAAAEAAAAEPTCHNDEYLKLSASIALGILKELKSPGVALLKEAA
jgi:hypothetical protein